MNSPNRLVSPCNSKVAIVYTFPFSLNKHVQPYKLLHQYDQNQRCQDQQCGDGGQSGVEGQLHIVHDADGQGDEPRGGEQAAQGHLVKEEYKKASSAPAMMPGRAKEW